MRDCKLKIITQSGNDTAFFEAEGTFEESAQGETVRYLIEGDEGEIIFSNNSFHMIRRGKCGLEATFLAGEETKMLLSDASLQGSIPVHTTHYSLQKEALLRSIELCYKLLGAGNIQTFSLKIQLFFSEEK